MSNSTCTTIFVQTVCDARSGCSWECSSSTGVCKCVQSSFLILIILLTIFGTLFLAVAVYCCMVQRGEAPGCSICYPPASSSYYDQPSSVPVIVPARQLSNGQLVLTGPPQFAPDDSYNSNEPFASPPIHFAPVSTRGARRGSRHRYFGPTGQPAHPPRDGPFHIAPNNIEVVAMRQGGGAGRRGTTRVAYSTESTAAPDYQQQEEELYEEDDEDYDENDGDFRPNDNNNPPPAFGIRRDDGFHIQRRMMMMDNNDNNAPFGSGSSPIPPPPPPPNLVRAMRGNSSSDRHVRFRE